MPFFMAAPKAGSALLGAIGAFSQLPLSADVRETAIIAAAAQFQGGYVVYSHVRIAAAAKLLTKEQLELLQKGQKPEGLSEECSIAFDVSKRLSATPGPMPQELWDRAMAVLGLDATIALIHYIGIYTYTSLFMNATDVQVPES
jgi:4-carboxymuconolactone decarboxylase